MAEVNRILYSDDCLNVLNDELALPTGSVDLIYLDPPFNSKSIYNPPFAGKGKDARPVEAFADTWTWGFHLGPWAPPRFAILSPHREP